MAYATMSAEERNTMCSGCEMLKANAALLRYDMVKKSSIMPT